MISQKISPFSKQISKEFNFLGNFTKNFDFLKKIPKISIFLRNFTKHFYFFRQFKKNQFFSRQISEKFRFLGNFTKNFDFPGINWLFAAISGQIILFLFKSHHFLTYLLYMVRYNNILRPVHDPHDPLRPPTTPLPKIWEDRDAQPPGLTPMYHVDHRKRGK